MVRERELSYIEAMSRTAAQTRQPPGASTAPRNMLEFFEPLRGTEMRLAESRSFRDRRMDELMQSFAEWDDEPPHS